jgi:hypothetical protein
MAAVVPRFKGTGLLPVVKALRLHPSGPSSVPIALRHYLDDYVVSGGWYPEQDYFALVQVLAELIRRDGRLMDVWEYFGKTSAQRDLAGMQMLVPERSRLDEVGAYRGFINNEATSVYSMFVRTSKLWSMYHDTGRMTAGRTLLPSVVSVRLFDFKFPARGLLELQTAYMCEYARLAGNSLSGRVSHSTIAGDPFCEWEYTCEPTEDVLQSIAQLPLHE